MQPLRLILLAALAAALAACGGSERSNGAGADSFASVSRQVQGLTGAPREQKLVELAHAEGGRLDFYNSMRSDTGDAVVASFEKATGIKVDNYRSTSELIVARVLEEAKAGRPGADVLRLNGTQLNDLSRAGRLLAYRSPSRSGLVRRALHPDWTADAFLGFVLSWNTHLIPSSQRPRSWQDLAAARWRGKVGLESTDVDWYETLWLYWVKELGMAPRRADSLFERMTQDALVVQGHSTLSQLMAAGEVAVAPNYDSSVDALQTKGAPITWKPTVEPVILESQGVGVVRGAKHPAAAMLFVDWLLGKGQETLNHYYETVARRDLAPAAPLRTIPVDLAGLAANRKGWSDRFQRLLSHGHVQPAP